MASIEEIYNRSETSNDRQRRLNQNRQRNYKRRRINNNIDIRHELGSMDQLCLHCGAKFWMDEKNQRSTQVSPTFSVCCANGKVRLMPLLKPPPYLMNLYTSSESEADSFRRNARSYNSLLACTSFGANVNDEFQGRGVSNFSIHGQIYHLIGPLLPEEGQIPRFAQLYIYDTEHEIRNRLSLMQNLDATILQNLQNILNMVNPYIHVFRQARDIFQTSETSNVSMVIHSDRTQDLRRYGAPTSSDVAALMIGDGHDINPSNRDILLGTHEGGLQRISELHPSYDALHYVLLFPKGDDGWHADIPLTEPGARKRVTQMQFYSYRLQIRNGDWIQSAGRLYQQYIVDQYAKIEQNRLNYLRQNQSELRTEFYQGAIDAMHAGDNTDNIGRRIILPSTFSGGPRYMYQLYQDAMAIVRHFGKPDLFITFTCNPKWPEITRELLPYQIAADRPDLTTRVFHVKLQEMMKDLCERDLFGKVIAYIYVIEFQKRGLPHAHILLILAPENKIRSIEEYDSIVSAEIPNHELNPLAYETVTTMMMHGPCGILNPLSPCMKDGKCQKHYPKNFQETTQENSDGYPVYRRQYDGRYVEIRNGIQLDNRWVIPYNIKLVEKYNAHINVEICNSMLAVKYLYIYVYKGHDRATVSFSQSINRAGQEATGTDESIDEIKMYLDARYVSSSESMWRIFHFKMHGRSPNVQRLAVHLPNRQTVTFSEEDNLHDIVNNETIYKTTLTAWFQENMDNTEAQNYKYTDFPVHYTWNATLRKWNRRKNATGAIGRLYMVQPIEGERYYLRILLTHVTGATSFDNLKTVNGQMCRTFKEACTRLGLLQNDDEWNTCLYEASNMQTGKQLRHLFAMILLMCQPLVPEQLWNTHKLALCEDILYHAQQLAPSQTVILNDTIENEALNQIEHYLQSNGMSLENFPHMPIPLIQNVHSNYANDNLDQLIYEERSYDTFHLTEQVRQNIPLLNKEQRSIYDKVIQAIDNECGCFFIDGPAGTGKTFLYNILLANVRSHGDIAIAVASSGIAAQLISGGRTAHSRFKIPFKIDEFSTCKISRNDKLARLINMAKLFVWDEAPMMHKFVFEAVDRTFRDITQVNKPFGGKVFVFGGDFRQVLPIIPHSLRADVVSASLIRSSLWVHIKIMKLSKNMRLQQTCNPLENLKQKQFGEFLLKVGDGIYTTNPGTEDIITLPSDIVILKGTLTSLIDFVYPDLVENSGNANYMVSKAILTPKNVNVEAISDIIMERIPGEVILYPSADLVDLPDDSTIEQPQAYSPEFLRSLKIPELPPGELKLKLGIPIILLRNLNPSEGLCNGTRLICRGFQSKVIDAEIITGSHMGKRVFIPRITLTPSETKLPFILNRRQFPIRVAFSMTINKSQGQTLSRVGIYLPQPVFSHGQLYVALSRVTSCRHLKVLTENSDNCQTKNIVYHEIFHSI